MTAKTVTGSTRNFIHTVDNRLQRVENESGTTIASYYYDPFGRRLWKDVGGIRSCFYYNDEGLAGEYDASGNELRTYGYHAGSAWASNPLFVQQNGVYYWYQNDHLGTPQKIIAENGAIVWSARYDVFGRATVETAVIENNLRFPGQYFDVETGLHYNRHRYYDPEIGRYISADPIGLAGGINLYAYVRNDPVNAVDPWGLACILKSIIETRITGNSDTITRLDSQQPLDPLIDSFPATGYSLRLEHKYEREEWAQFDVLVEICTDDCGNFIRRTEISANKKKGTEYWVNVHEWQRYRTIMFNVPFPVNPFSPSPLEEWREIY